MATNKSDPAARQYARALFEVAFERSQVGRVFEELAALNGAYENDHGFHEFFTTPKIAPERKHQIFKDSLGESFSEIMTNFVGLLMKKRRETLLDNIFDAFEIFRDGAENRLHVYLESATELTEKVKRDLISKLAAISGKEVSLHASTDPNLIAGMRLRVGERSFDNSMRTRLAELSHHLLGPESALVAFSSLESVEALYAAGAAAKA